jgi:hypothetical protein
MESMESQEAGFPPFPHSLEIPSGLPHSHGPDCWHVSRSKSMRNRIQDLLVLKGVVMEVLGPKCNGCSGTLTYERPHEGISNATPGSLYQPSSVLLPRNPIEFVYPHGFILRRANNSGDISWHKGRVFVSEVFRFEILGFEQVDEDFYKVYFRDVEIAEFDADTLRFRPAQVMR